MAAWSNDFIASAKHHIIAFFLPLPPRGCEAASSTASNSDAEGAAPTAGSVSPLLSVSMRLTDSKCLGFTACLLKFTTWSAAALRTL